MGDAGLVLAFVLSGVAATALLAVWKEPPVAWLTAGAIAGPPLFIAFNLALPFFGALSDLLASLVAAVASVPVMLLVLRTGLAARWGAANRLSVWSTLLFGMVLLGLCGVMFALSSRLTYSAQLDWACDGVVQKVFRAEGHQAPSVAVASGGGEVVLESVDEALFDRARPGARLVKERGAPSGTLDGRPVRVVRAQLGWWNGP